MRNQGGHPDTVIAGRHPLEDLAIAVIMPCVALLFLICWFVVRLVSLTWYYMKALAGG